MQDNRNTETQNHRMLALYRMLLCGEALCKKELAARYGIREKSIQRDIENLRKFIAETEPEDVRLVYRRRENRYILEKNGAAMEDACEIVCGIAAILRDAPGISAESRTSMLDWLFDRLPPAERYRVWKQAMNGSGER